MKRSLLALLAAAAATPAAAQHAGHPAPTSPPPGSLPPASADSGATDPHAGHDMGHAQDPHAGHDMHQAQDPHAGHDMHQAQDPLAGHELGQAGDPHRGHRGPSDAALPPLDPPPPEALTGPEHAADLVFGREAMIAARNVLRREHGAMTSWGMFADQIEVGFRSGEESFAWGDVQLRYGNDIDRLWLKTEGEGVFGEGIERAEVQALWSHALDPWFDLQAGLRYDFAPDPERAYLAVGVQGLAPYWFEIDATAFVSTKGDLAARVEVEYDQRITQRLVLQPSLEADLSLQDVPELGIGSGLSTAELGLRLRYEIVPEFAPYLGVQYERAFGDTARFARSAGEDVGGWSLVAGIRAWF